MANTRLSLEQPGQTLQATDLAREVYQRLVDGNGGEAKWNGTGRIREPDGKRAGRFILLFTHWSAVESGAPAELGETRAGRSSLAAR